MTLAIETKPITPEEFLRMPDMAGVELVHGTIVEKPVSLESTRIGGRILYLLSAVVNPGSLGAVYGSDLGYQCYSDAPYKIRKPDVSFISRERLPTGYHGFSPIPADLAVEVISPNDLAEELQEKVEEYIDSGVRLVWVVYPAQKVVVMHRADTSAKTFRRDDEIDGGDVLPTFRRKVSEFF